MTEVNKRKAKKAAQIAKRVGLVLAATTAATTLIACPPEPKPGNETCNCTDKEHDCNCGKEGCTCKPKDPTCECDPGTLHVTGEDCNSENECNCTHADGVRVNGIAVTKHKDISAGDFTNMVTQVTDALDFFEGNRKTYIKDTLKEIKIIPGTPGAPAEPINGILIITNGSITDDIWGTISDWLDEKEIVMLFKQFDNSKNNVRMALNGALRSSVDELMQHSVAQNKSKQDEKRANALA